MDAGIIVAAQKVEHYEIAAYGAVCEYARIMGHADALSLLEQTLEEEKRADQRLNKLAEGGINALAERDSNGDDDAMATNGSTRRRSPAKNGRARSRK